GVLERADQGRGENGDIGEGEVEALGPGGRDRVGAVGGEEKRTVLHRLGHGRTVRQHRLVGDRPSPELEAVGPGDQGLQFGPDPIIGTVGSIVAREGLEVQELGGASQRRPNQAKGYSWKYRCRVVSGIIARQGPREPSEPTTYRASMRSSSPSTVVAATQGRSLSISPRRVSDTE